MFAVLALIFVTLAAISLVGGLVLIGEAKRRRPDYPACRACQYNLSGLSDLQACPECGVKLTPETIRQPREIWVSRTMIAVGIAIVFFSPFAWCAGFGLLVQLLRAF